MKTFHGIFPALLTPFTPQDAIDHSALAALVRMNLQKGVSGFYVGGSTAEAFLLSEQERRSVLETVVGETAGACTVIAHVGSISTKEAVSLARHAQQAGADAISAIPPFYYNFSAAEIRSYFLALADAVTIPVILYCFPANSGVSFSVADYDGFLKDGRFLGVKFTSNDFYTMERIRYMHPDAVVYNGYDQMLLPGFAAGATGGIGSTYNIMAEKYMEILRLHREGKPEEARAVQQQANNVLTVLKRAGVIPSLKAALSMMGLPFGECRKPFGTLTQEDRQLVRQALAENGIACE